ncbi:MAG: hypothetical protein HKM93_16095 [Desulfobacteraceae bacterium]|nr:hypothetical protein [Desulfobacteraceae bacterium]
MEITEASLQMLQDDYGFKTEQGWKNEISSKAEEIISKNSDGLEVRKEPGCADYRITLSIDTVETFNYFITSKMVDMGRAYIIDEVQIKKGADFDAMLSKSIERFGDIADLIKTREEEHPWPARNPRLEITLSPPEVSFQAGKDQSIITVRVFHCNGKLVRLKQPVYFSVETARGKIDTHQGTQGDDGFVTATYNLDPAKGTHPGKDVINVRTNGFCGRRYTKEAEIKIKPYEARLMIEKNPSVCTFENRCVVQIPFKMIETKDPEIYDIKENVSNRISYEQKCAECNEISGTFWAKLNSGKLDLKRNPKRPLTLSFEIFRDNEVLKISCKQPPIIIPRKQQQMDMALRKWPLIDGYSEQIGVFTYTLYLGKASK